MRHRITNLSLFAVMLIAACGGGSVESDLNRSGDDVRKDAKKMSVSELQKKIDELEKYAKELESEVGKGEPTQAQMEKMTKLVEITGIYTIELMNKQMNK